MPKKPPKRKPGRPRERLKIHAPFETALGQVVQKPKRDAADDEPRDESEPEGEPEREPEPK